MNTPLLLSDFALSAILTYLMWLWTGSLTGAIVLVAVSYAIVLIIDMGSPDVR
jgi:hypothetical protein